MPLVLYSDDDESIGGDGPHSSTRNGDDSFQHPGSTSLAQSPSQPLSSTTHVSGNLRHS